MVCMPTPATLGSKVVPVIPVPEKVPELGDAKRDTGPSSTHTSGPALKVKVGSAKTSISSVTSTAHPLPPR